VDLKSLGRSTARNRVIELREAHPPWPRDDGFGPTELLDAAVERVRAPLTRQKCVSVLGLFAEMPSEVPPVALLELIESTPGLPVWALLEHASCRAIVELRLRLAARSYRLLEGAS
jgi:hypothetical protein